jgi:NAD(P)-dependent dehydrogenase (short-subunit alcohol dehydrogenase family)
MMAATGRLAGRVCVVTGASGGIGAASVEAFQQAGAKVVGVDLLAGAPGELALQADLTSEQEVRDVYTQVRERFGRIDVLFNNAGISPNDDGSVIETALEAWERVQAVNLRSVFLCCKHGLPHLLENDGPERGSVINTASFVAVMGAATSQISYTASKGGVLALSRELGVEFARRGIRVNALCPGPVDTPLLQELYAKDPEQAARRLIHVPMGRFADASEIASAALFLASAEASFVTAATFLVDGGLSGAYTTPLD